MLWSTFKGTPMDSTHKHIPVSVKLSCKGRTFRGQTASCSNYSSGKGDSTQRRREPTAGQTIYFLKKECRRRLRKAEWDHVCETITEGLYLNNTNPCRHYIKSKKQESVDVAPLKKNGTLLCDSKEKAKILVNQFQEGGQPPSILRSAVAPRYI